MIPGIEAGQELAAGGSCATSCFMVIKVILCGFFMFFEDESAF
jgi:hypothetical protein